MPVFILATPQLMLIPSPKLSVASATSNHSWQVLQ
jgi:hypothetical protein